MYNAYFGFAESPFENKLDQRFLFLSDDHKEVLAALVYLIREGKGIAMVCGDVGTGKTMLLNYFINQLPASVHPIIIANPLVDYHEIILYIARNLEIDYKDMRILQLIDEVKRRLIEAMDHGKSYVLIVDEAHMLSEQNLDHIRLLSNIETLQQNLLQILLIGQYELSHRLSQPTMRQLQQRITINRFLSPLTYEETIKYINFRLQKVGSDIDSCFDSNCKDLIFTLTGGVPRRINQVCDNALLICMTENSKKINKKILNKANEALLTDKLFSPNSSAYSKSKGMKNKKILVAAAALGVALFLGNIIAYTVGGEKKGSQPTPATFSTGDLISRDDSNPTHGEQSSPILQDPIKEASPVTLSPKNRDDLLPENKHGTDKKSSSERPANELDVAEIKRSGSILAKYNKDILEGEKLGKNFQTSDNKVDNKNRALEIKPRAETRGKIAKLISPDYQTLAALQGPNEVTAIHGDSFDRIAAQWYPNQKELGLTAILLANPEYTSEDNLIAGKKVTLPVIFPDKQVIQLKDNVFYALHRTSNSLKKLQKSITAFKKEGIRYVVLMVQDIKAVNTYRLILGGYDNMEELEEILKKHKEESDQS